MTEHRRAVQKICKRSVRLLAAVCLSALTVVSANAGSVKGDLNEDGTFDAADYLLLKRHILGTCLLPDSWADRGDLNGDGDLSVVDYVMLKRIILPPVPHAPDSLSAVRSEGVSTNLGDDAVRDLNTYLQSLDDVSVYYASLDGSVYYSFRSSRSYRTASTAKVPYCQWLCELADQGIVELDELLAFDREKLRKGSAVLENAQNGQTFSVRELMDYAVRYSDNTAFRMLVYRFGTEAYAAYLRTFGLRFVPERFGLGACDAADMAVLLYHFYQYRSNHPDSASGILWEAGTHTSYRTAMASVFASRTVFSKYGALVPPNEITYNEVGIVLSGKPFLLVILSNLEPGSAEKAEVFRTICGHVALLR